MEDVMVVANTDARGIVRSMSYVEFELFLARHSLASVLAFVRQVERRSEDWEDTRAMHEVLQELREYVRGLTEAQE